MTKAIVKRTVIVLVGILVVFLARGLFYYTGFYSAPPSEMPSYDQIIAPAAPSTEFSDVYEEGEGTILVDLAHNNAFNMEELNVLILRLVSRDLNIKFFDIGDDLEDELLGKKEDQKPSDEGDTEGEDLEEKPPADAFLVVCPLEEFSEEEGETINEFVNNGGRLLLIADPTRRGKINSLSYNFGLIFEPDYLYNMNENDANYRNIFITEFKESEITEKLQNIVLYTAGSISSASYGIAFGDENTFSSLIETRKDLAPIAQAQESKVVAIHDITFMTEPYNGIQDNNQLVSNIANWLASPIEEEIQ